MNLNEAIDTVIRAGYEVLHAESGANISYSEGGATYQEYHKGCKDSNNEEEIGKLIQLFISDTSEEGMEIEPECSATEEEIEESGIECEFINRDGSWWCTSHNCWA